MKTLIKEPQLKIQSGQDGVWLHFKASNGISSSINLHLQEGSMVKDGLRQWAKDYAIKNPPKQ
jgi:hypothetical protein